MGRRNGGYGGYRGRRTFHDILKWVAAILAVLVVILAGVLVFGQRYLVFRDQGVRLELPFLHQKDGQQSGPGDVSLEVRPQGDQSGEDQSAQKPGADETEALRAVCPHMVRRQQGSIVTVSSMWGVTGGSCEAAYSAAKAGVIGLTKAMAKELGPSHIRVNCVAPGVIDTEMNAHLSQADMDALGEETPLGRIGRAEEAARAIFYLASEQSAFVTGQVLQVDGGMVI